MALKAQKQSSKPYPKLLKSIGDHIKKKRLDLNMQQKELAERLGVTVCTVRNWEKNRSNPSLTFIPKIIQFLDYTPYDISKSDFGKKIVIKRYFLGLSQKQLGHRVGVDPSTIRCWEKGRRWPKKKLIKRLAAFLISENPSVK